MGHTINILGHTIHYATTLQGELIREDGTITTISREIKALEAILDELFEADGWKKTRTGKVKFHESR